MSNSIKNSIQLAHNELEDLSVNKSNQNASPIFQHFIKRQSTANSSIHTCNGDNGDTDLNENEDDFVSDLDLSRHSKIIQNNLTNVYIAPSPGERDAVRRASMKLKKAKEELIIEPKSEINAFSKLDDIPIIDDSNGESGINDDDDNKHNSKKKNNGHGKSEMFY